MRVKAVALTAASALAVTVAIYALYSAHATLADKIVEPVKDASAIHLRQSFSSRSMSIESSQSVEAIVEEVNSLRLKPWHSAVVKHGSCMMQVTFLQHGKRLLHLYVYADKMYEIPSDRQQPHFYVNAGAAETPALRAALSTFGLPEYCKW